ncbi:hypothetical protein HU200_063324 [Digitaria exilis]|uniref:Floricaula/leafy-like transcription factor n=1 Tax=Digitaria exilis TaxID=1010633 RepID=A0A835ABW0_9POAL|nr:hypothetical protein HU200_063324 [Digitaria exilis]
MKCMTRQAYLSPQSWTWGAGIKQKTSKCLRCGTTCTARLDEEASDARRRAYKARGENVGAWRQAFYAPLAEIASRHGFDVDAVFTAHPRLAIWYVPTTLRQLCHQARSSTHAATAGLPPAPAPPYVLPYRQADRRSHETERSMLVLFLMLSLACLLLCSG